MPAQSHQQHGRHIMVFEQPSGADYNLRKSSDLQTTHLYVVCYVEVSNGQVLARSRKKHLHSRWQIRLKFCERPLNFAETLKQLFWKSHQMIALQLQISESPETVEDAIG